MFIWDHSENWLTHWDASRAHAIKILNQYHQNFISKQAVYPDQTKVVSDIPESISVDLVIPSSDYVINSSIRKFSSADVIIWHRPCGHPSPNTIGKISNANFGAKVTGSYDGVCTGCLLTKSKRIVSRIPVDKGKDFWSRMHVDLIIFPKVWNGELYAIHAYDAKGHGHLIETVSSKDQLTLTRSVKNMITRLQNEGRNVQILYSDNEKGFGIQFKQMLNDKAIILNPQYHIRPSKMVLLNHQEIEFLL